LFIAGAQTIVVPHSSKRTVLRCAPAAAPRDPSLIFINSPGRIDV
jgi:hypothetical protein